MIGTMTALNNTPCYVRHVSQKKDMFIIEKRIHTKRHYITKDMNNCSILPGTMYKQNRTNKTQSYGAIICVLASNLCK